MSYCERCPYKGKRIVNGEGPRDAKIVIVAEAPGATEDRLGRPFVGDAGYRLDNLLQQNGIHRAECYITNVLKCRPPENNIKTDEGFRAIQCCTPQLHAELRMFRQNVLVPLGNTALNALGIKGAISHVRGSLCTTPFGKAVPTYHPAYYMRNPEEYISGLYDFKKIRRHSYSPGLKEVPEKFCLYPSVEDVERFSMHVNGLLAKGERPILSFDLETYVGHYMEIPMKLVSFALNAEEAIVVPFITESGNWYWKSQEEELHVIQLIGDLFADPRLTKMAFNAVFDVTVAMNHGFEFNGPVIDPMIAHHILYENLPHNLEYVASIFSDYPPWKMDKGNGDDLKYRTYNARDSIVLHLMIEDILQDLKENGQHQLFLNVCAQIVPTAHMRLTGLPIDETKRSLVKSSLESSIEEHRLRLQEMSGLSYYNPNSTVQTAQILFEKLKLKSEVHTDGGALSTKDEVLTKLMIRYPQNEFLPILAAYRGATKLLQFVETPVFQDGRAHSEFMLTGTVTGRFASKNPNLQNLPSKKRDKEGFVRAMFSAAPGYKLLEADFSQAELRIFALLAHDEPWLAAFAEGKDVHGINCVDMFGELRTDWRLYAKNIIFGFIYGSEGSGIEAILPKELLAKMSVQVILDNLKATHPALFRYRDYIANEVEKTKRLRNPFGRTRWYPVTPSKKDLRTAFNFPITSTVSDMMHIKMRLVYENRGTSSICLNLHDALYLMVPDEDVASKAKMLREIMEEPIEAGSLTLQLPCSIEVGTNLFEMAAVGGSTV